MTTLDFISVMLCDLVHFPPRISECCPCPSLPSPLEGTRMIVPTPPSVSVDSFECAASLDTVLYVARILLLCSLFVGPGSQRLAGFNSKM